MYKVIIADIAELTEEIVEVEFNSEIIRSSTFSSKIIATISITGQISFDLGKPLMKESTKSIAAWSLLKPSSDDTYKKVSVLLSGTGEIRYELQYAFVLSYCEQFEDQNGFFKLVVKEVNPEHTTEPNTIKTQLINDVPSPDITYINDRDQIPRKEYEALPQAMKVENGDVSIDEVKQRFIELEKYRIDNKIVGGCLSITVVDGKSVFGKSGSLTKKTTDVSRIIMENMSWAPRSKPKDLRGAQVLRHAEADSIFEAVLQYGKELPDNLVLYVEKPTCPHCMSGLPYVMRHLGIKKLAIYQKEVDDKDNPLIIDKWPEIPELEAVD